jgi:DNA repair exonuclease SbcCD ATPase subunit
VDELLTHIEKLKSELDGMRAVLSHYSDSLSSVRTKRDELKTQIDSLEQRVDALQRASALLQSLSNLSRERVSKHLSEIVSTALQYVYGSDFKFELELVTDKRGNTTVEYYVTSGDGIRTRPQDSRGGGVVDVISIALRIGVLLLMNNPPLPGPIILDEPGRHLDQESAVRFAEFLKYISSTTGRQFIVVTHHEAMLPYADAAYVIEKSGDISTVSEVDVNGG